MHRAKTAVERLYTDLCCIFEFQSKTNETTGLTTNEPVLIQENIPCRLSYSKLSEAKQTETGATLTQSISLFLSPSILVKEGSSIQVRRNGLITFYQCSGTPAYYDSHQEVPLSLKEEWA